MRCRRTERRAPSSSLTRGRTCAGDLCQHTSVTRSYQTRPAPDRGHLFVRAGPGWWLWLPSLRKSSQRPPTCSGPKNCVWGFWSHRVSEHVGVRGRVGYAKAAKGSLSPCPRIDGAWPPCRQSSLTTETAPSMALRMRRSCSSHSSRGDRAMGSHAIRSSMRLRPGGGASDRPSRD